MQVNLSNPTGLKSRLFCLDFYRCFHRDSGSAFGTSDRIGRFSLHFFGRDKELPQRNTHCFRYSCKHFYRRIPGNTLVERTKAYAHLVCDIFGAHALLFYYLSYSHGWKAITVSCTKVGYSNSTQGITCIIFVNDNIFLV